MVLVEVDPVVMLSSGISPSSRMLPVLPDPPVAVGDVPAELAGLLAIRAHRQRGRKEKPPVREGGGEMGKIW